MEQTFESANEVLDHFGADLNLYQVLRLPTTSANPDRIRSAYVKLSYLHYPTDGQQDSTTFEQITLAFLALVDPECRRIYDELGLVGLVQSETYQESPIYSRDPYRVYEDFYKGVDPKDKEWLLLNGTNNISEDEHGDEHEDNEELPEVEEAAGNGAEAVGGGEEPAVERVSQEIKEKIINKPIPLPPLKAGSTALAFASMGHPCKSEDGTVHNEVWKQLNHS